MTNLNSKCLRRAVAFGLALIVPAVALAGSTAKPAQDVPSSSYSSDLAERIGSGYGKDLVVQYSEEIDYFFSLDVQGRRELLAEDAFWPVVAVIAANTPGLAATTIALVPLTDKPGVDAVKTDMAGKSLLDY